MRTRLAFVLLLAVLPSVTSAFDETDTHRLMTGAATKQSTVDSWLKTELSLDTGIETPLRDAAGSGQAVLQWLRGGSLLEDRPACRASNHFHHPLRSFTASQVTDIPGLALLCPDFQPTRSNVVWGTRFVSPTEQGPATSNAFDWDAARRAFSDALTLPTPGAREAALARTFETLGHVMHLVQDLAVPAHVRNDFRSHLTNLRPSSVRPAEEAFEKYVRVNPSLIDGATPVPVTIAGRFVTRFWDTDRYTGATPSADAEQGLAEYTNANFVSLNTILTENLVESDPYFHPYPRLTSTNADALFGKDASVARAVRAEDGRVDTGVYLDKLHDGEIVPNFLRAGYLTGDFIDRAPPGALRRLVFQVDDTVYASHAAKLIPRALGYSVALLDYFARGRLDVDLLEADPADPSIVRVRGTNASPDALLEGSLTLWTDDPTGRRAPAALLDATASLSAGPGDPLESARFQLPADAERVVAVYAGRLGEEAGAVIGKVLGGVRVEEIFVDDVQRWVIRTPRQSVLLSDDTGPLTYERFEEVKWGDDDNLLVARTPFGVGQPNRVVVYRVPRGRDLEPPEPAPTDTLEILSASTDDGQVVTLERMSSTPSFGGIALGSTVTIDHTIAYRQQLARYTRTDVYTFQPFVPGGSFGQYLFDHTEFSPLDVQIVDSATQSYHDEFALRVDADHYQTFNPPSASWAWSFADFTATADGRVLALVRVDLTAPAFSRQDRVSRQVKGLVLTFVPDPGGAGPGHFRVDLVTRQSCSSGFFCFPEGVGIARDYPRATFWALVDLTAGVTLACTAAPSVTFTSSRRVEAPRWAVGGAGPDPLVYAVLAQRRRGGGPSDTTDGDDEIQNLVALSTRSEDGDPVDVSGGLDLDIGEQARSAGLLRADLEAAVAGLGMLGTVSASGGGPADVLFGASGSQDRARLRVTTPPPPPGQRTIDVDSASRVRPAAGNERLVLGANGSTSATHATALIDWDPLGQRLRVPQLFEIPAGEFAGVSVGPATPEAVLVNDPLRSRGYLVPLDGAGTVRTIPDPGALYGFTLLSPRFLYGRDTLRFHRADASLLPTALPARLIDLPNNPFGDYHAIRVP